MPQAIVNFINEYIPMQISISDIIEIIIISVLFYEVMVWIKNTRAWMLFKGIIMLLVFTLLASIFNMTTILWIADKTFSVGIIAVIIVFQPELRKALEQLGRKNILSDIFTSDDAVKSEKFSDKTIQEIVKATFELAKTKTGALMVIEQDILLNEYERTGIPLDSLISSQLLINIFEHNTPLHDGAIIVRGERITSATCYLPLSENMQISKDLGTRHRAALGMSEVSDALVVVVSEETGHISVAIGGRLARNITGEQLDEQLTTIQYINAGPKRSSKGKGRKKSEV